MYTQWIENLAVQRLSVRDGLVLDFDDCNEIVISCPLLLTLLPSAPIPSRRCGSTPSGSPLTNVHC